MDTITERKIKEAADIVDVVGDFVELKKRGTGYVGLCPFHDDHTIGSFQVSPSKQMCKCFSCDKGGDAIWFLMEKTGLSYGDALRWLAQKYSIYIDEDYDRERFKAVTPSKPRSLDDVSPAKGLLVMPRDIVKDTMHRTDHNIFCTWLRHLPWTDERRERLEKMMWLYCVGAWNDGRVCFWQIDENGQPHGGKLMTYELDGHRDKTRNPGWMHNQQGVRERLDLEHYEYRPTLFGMHLTRKFPQAVIHLVESEKTALICATHYGDTDRNLWLACGGLKFLKPEMLRPLIEQERTIYLWPDKDGIGEWEKVRNTIADSSLKANVMMNTDFITRYWREEDGPKADVADIIIRIMRTPSGSKPADTGWKDGNPFMPQDELNDPELHRMRMKMARCHSAGWVEPMTCQVEDVKALDEILDEHPLLKKII